MTKSCCFWQFVATVLTIFKASDNTCCFRINEGGHFDNVAERIADGIRWLLAGDID